MHHDQDAQSVRCFVVTVSDTRTPDNDESGALLVDALEQAGHVVVGKEIVPDVHGRIADRVLRAAEADDVQAVLITGGTGFSARDVTPEAVEPLLSRDLPGFGEAFRRISYDQIGTHGLLSRAFAGAIGPCVVFGLPGSKKACRTAVDALILPMLSHLVGLSAGPRTGRS